ncbi:N-acetylmuramoyl-L-alanine amidase [Halobacillus mangrovi]|uniref:N-acetylmuramoyl-L-alanine amidase n=1 Tax=Halobacillus mangrovi TaxID=402384 RepID=UPI003D9597CA
MIRKITPLLFAAFILLLASFLPTNVAHADSLSDIPSRSSDEINYLMDQGVITGYPDGTYRPNNSVNRQEAATMVGRALDLNGTKRSTSFPDVHSSSYASGYIQSAYGKNIITGYPDGTYKPRNEINRGEMAYLISKAFNLNESSGNQYSDVPDSGALSTAIDQVSTAGIANGYPDGTYRPYKSITREEFALLVARGMNPEYKVDGDDLQVIGEKVVSTGILNVRSGPSTGYAKIGQLTEGTVIKVYKKVGDWWQFAYNGGSGYVHGAYVMDKQTNDGKYTIAIDAGHGGHDGGATANGLLEKEVNLDVAKRVRDYLSNSNINVVMTRDDDSFLELDERVDNAVGHGADTFVSIHSNAYPNESVSGVETFYSSAALSGRAYDSYKLAHFIQNRVVEAMNSNDRGVKDVPYRVIHATPLPSALIELGFLTNDSDASKLGSSWYRDRAAKAIYLGVIDYYNWKY